MTVVGQEYKSELGWHLTLPSGWERLDTAGGDELVAVPPVAFGYSHDWSLSFSWMVLSPADRETIGWFSTLTMSAGPLSSEQAASVIQKLSPTIGDVERAGVIELEDGTMAMEVEESFFEHGSSVVKKGYQLIFPFFSGPGEMARLQRICFYAPAPQFMDHIDDVRESARSFGWTLL